jgi:hypothetical protein
MEKVFVTIRSTVITGAVIFTVMCAVPGCKGSKKLPEQRESTIDSDKDKFRRDSFDKEMK